MISKILVFVLFFLASFIWQVNADTIYLRNGRSIEGLIMREDEERVELNIGFGTLKFRREDIKSIYKSKPDEVAVILQEWQRQKELQEEAMRKKEFQPKEIEFSQAGEHIVVNALLNKKVRASLLVDTGASLVLLPTRIAEKLEIKTRGEKEEIVLLKMADGREVEARYIVLDSVNVQDVEARDVGTVVLLDDAKMDIQDGLLGMSFLNKFNFQIDTVNKKLILKRLE